MSFVQLEPKHLKIVSEILQKLQIEVYVFGSRAKGLAKPLSDLDLCIKKNYSKDLIRKLQDEFEEADLPFKVDVVVWTEITENFKQHIQNDLVLLTRIRG